MIESPNAIEERILKIWISSAGFPILLSYFWKNKFLLPPHQQDAFVKPDGVIKPLGESIHLPFFTLNFAICVFLKFVHESMASQSRILGQVFSWIFLPLQSLYLPGWHCTGSRFDSCCAVLAKCRGHRPLSDNWRQTWWRNTQVFFGLSPLPVTVANEGL